MSVRSRTDLLPQAMVAALVGSLVGGTAGLWSLRSPAASVIAAAPAPQPARVDTMPVTRAAHPASADTPVLVQAQTLARRPDVMALMALRDDVVRRASTRAASNPASLKSELDEIDRRLNEARTLQLKLDAEAFRKATAER